MLADDNRDFVNLLKEYLDNEKDIHIVSMVHNGRDVIDIIPVCQPDIVILDIIMPKVDGLGVLEWAWNAKLDKKPKFIVLSGMGQERITHHALELGAIYYIIKPFDLDILVNRIRHYNDDLAGRESDSGTNAGSARNEDKTLQCRNEDLEISVTEAIRLIGVPAHIKGYQYLRDAIVDVIQDPQMVNSVTKRLYPAVAFNYKTTPSRVERAIRHAIEVAWNRGCMDTLTSIFGNTIHAGKGKPTNSEFIAMIADRIKLERSKGKTPVHT